MLVGYPIYRIRQLIYDVTILVLWQLKWQLDDFLLGYFLWIWPLKTPVHIHSLHFE